MSVPARPHADDVAAAVATARERIGAAARRAGRDPGAVTLVAATKGVAPVRLAQALEAGVGDLGENRAQELVAKAPELASRNPRWHFLGSLQRNKVRALAPWVRLWQSVDRRSLGEELARRAPGAAVLVQVNLGGEERKAGVEPGALPALRDDLLGLGLDVRGLMTLPPHDGAPRRWFAALRELAERCELAELSMGMSEDYEVAVEEGATLVRIGRALFGER